MTGIVVGLVWLVSGIGVLASALVKTVRLLQAGHGVRAAAAFGIFMVWVLASVVAVFFLQMFGSASVAALHGHEAPVDNPAVGMARWLIVGYPLAALLLLGALRLLSAPARIAPAAVQDS